jgi:hypothetical protein
MKRKIPKYVENAILWLSDDGERPRALYKLMPHAAYRVGAGFLNAEADRLHATNKALPKQRNK